MNAKTFLRPVGLWAVVAPSLCCLIAPPTLAAAPPAVAARDHAAMGHGGAAKKPTPAGVVSLDVYAEGDRLHLLTATADAPGGAPRMQYRRSDDAGRTWSEPVPVGTGQPAPQPAHRGMDAQIAAAGDHLVALWTCGAPTRFGRGPLASAISADGGRTWRPGPDPSDDGQPGDHAFVDVTADAQGTFHAVWLDARVGQTGKGLRYARSTDGGATWSANQTLDADSCECCWNTVATAPGGKVFVLYRDQHPRDMAIVSSDDGGQTWSKPVTVGAFGWEAETCPHVGGGLAVVPAGDGGIQLGAVVWTGKGTPGAMGAYALWSRDGGRSWTEPVRLGNAASWHADVVQQAGRLVAVWDAYTDDGTGVFAASSTDQGKTWTPAQRLSDAGASATHPRAVHTSQGARVFWTEQRPGRAVEWRSSALSKHAFLVAPFE